MSAVSNYFEQFSAADTTVPGKKALLPIAKVLDAATEQALTGLMTVLRGTKEHQARVALLEKQPRIAGNFDSSKVLFEGLSAFEQMVAMSDWLADAHIRKSHTFFLSAGGADDYVPLQAKKFKTTHANMMHVVLGSTSGSHKAPKYADWAETDPREDVGQSVFIYPLEGLEIIRQPYYSAATVLKGNVFEKRKIDSQWRYGDEFACVETRGQKKATAKKQSSAGLNACTLVNRFSNEADPKAEEVDIALPIKFENYADEGYNDNLNTSVTAGAVVNAVKQVFVKQDWADLCRLMETLTIAKLGVPTTPALKQHIAERLVANGSVK